MEQVELEEWAKARILIAEVTNALVRGVKHYNKEGKLFTTALEVIQTLHDEGSVIFDTPESIARRN